jgi:hypothetical protein
LVLNDLNDRVPAPETERNDSSFCITWLNMLKCGSSSRNQEKWFFFLHYMVEYATDIFLFWPRGLRLSFTKIFYWKNIRLRNQNSTSFAHIVILIRSKNVSWENPDLKHLCENLDPYQLGYYTQNLYYPCHHDFDKNPMHGFQCWWAFWGNACVSEISIANLGLRNL